MKTESIQFRENIKYSKPPDEHLSHRNALLEIFCKIDVLNEIQEENHIVLNVFDDVYTIAALFEYFIFLLFLVELLN